MAISREQIFQVADELDAAGQSPTLAAVRKALDGGSYTTISEAMKEWRAAKAADATPIQEPPPAGVMDKLSEVGAEIWAIALELANGRLASEREGLEVARLETEASRLEAVELADQLAVELDESRSQVVDLERLVQELRAEADNLKAKLAAAVERATTAEARSGEMELRANDLRSELDRAHLEADKNRQVLERVQEGAEQAAKDHKSELVQVQAEAKQAVNECRAEIEQLRAQHGKELIKAQEAAAAAQGEAKDGRAEIAQLRVRWLKAQDAQEVAAAARAEAKQAVKERNSALEVAGAAKEEAASLRGRIEGLEIALSHGKSAAGSQK